MNIYKRFGDLIKEHRKLKGLSTQEISKLLDISVGLFNNIENSRHDVFKLELLFKLANLLDIPINEIATKEKTFAPDIYIPDLNLCIESKYTNTKKSDINIMNYYLKDIIFTIADLLYEYENDAEAAKIFISHINHEFKTFESIKKLK